MECPHCDYKDGWDGEQMKSIDGEEGEFWKLMDHKMLRGGGLKDYGGPKMITLYGCPKCKKTFIED